MELTRYVLKFSPEAMLRYKNWCKPESCYVDRDSTLHNVFPTSFWEAMVFDSKESALAFKAASGLPLRIAKQSLVLKDEDCAE